MKIRTVLACSLSAFAASGVAAQGLNASPGTESSTGDGCGRISAFTSMPRSQELFPIILRRIDGVEIPSAGSAAVKVPTGKHTLMVADAIPAVEFNTTERAELRQLRNRRMAQFVFFDVEVEPDTTYYLAAKLAPYPRDVTNNKHWEPVIWKQRNERCR